MASHFGLMVLRNLCYYAAFLAIFSPVVILTVPELIRTLRKRFPGYAQAILTGVGLYTVAELANHTLVFNPRFVLLPSVLLSILAAKALTDRMAKFTYRRWAGPAVVVFHLALVLLCRSAFDRYHFGKARAARETFATLDSAPDRSVFLPGRLTPVVEYYQKLRGRSWRVIPAGWAFEPEQVADAIRLCRREGYTMLLVHRRYWPEARFRGGQYRAYQKLFDRGTRASDVKHFLIVDLRPATTGGAER
jgi:hypothetical protein